MRTSLYYLYVDLIVFGRSAAFIAALYVTVAALVTIAVSLLCAGLFSTLAPVVRPVAAPASSPNITASQALLPTAAKTATVVQPLSPPVPLARRHPTPAAAIRDRLDTAVSAVLELTAPNGPPLPALAWLAAAAIIAPIIFAALGTPLNRPGGAMYA